MCDVKICSKLDEDIVRLGINGKPQASLVWQTDIEFHQCTSGVARFDWPMSPRRAEIGSWCRFTSVCVFPIAGVWCVILVS
jgi:hypothetical protein